MKISRRSREMDVVMVDLEVVVFGDRAYVVGFPPYTAPMGLQEVDISAPSTPIPSGSTAFQSDLDYDDMAISGGLLYVTKSRGIRVFRPWWPDAPASLGEVTTGRSSLSIAVSNGLVFVAEGSAGLTILRDCSEVFADGFESGSSGEWSATTP